MKIALTLLLLLLAPAAFAQSENLQLKSPEIGLHMGPLLPSQVDAVTETLLCWGLRMSAHSRFGLWELDNINSRRLGIVYNSTSLSYRIDFDNKYFPAHFLLGGHADHYKGLDRQDYKLAYGWHYGGGTSQQISGPLFVRFDFKSRFSPGASVYVGIGLLYRFTGDNSSDN